MIGGILVSTGLYAVLGSTLHFGFRDVFGGAQGETANAGVAPPTPSPAASEPVPPPAPPEPPAPPAG